MKIEDCKEGVRIIITDGVCAGFTGTIAIHEGSVKANYGNHNVWVKCDKDGTILHINCKFLKVLDQQESTKELTFTESELKVAIHNFGYSLKLIDELKQVKQKMQTEEELAIKLLEQRGYTVSK